VGYGLRDFACRDAIVGGRAGGTETQRLPLSDAAGTMTAMVHVDWIGPLRHLHQFTGPPSARQKELANSLGLRVTDATPWGVAAVLIESHVSSVVWGTTPKPVTEPQNGLLGQLGHPGAVDSRRVASAWIEHYYATRCGDALKRWKPVRGDKVTLEHDRFDVATGEFYRTTTDGVISSIGDNGLIYFRGGNGKCGWATHITRKYSDHS
jgi:hypothetical protein